MLKKISLALLSFVYCGAGIAHFIAPENYLRIMPPFLPWPLFLVYLSGAAEFGLGALLWWKRYRILAAWGLIALLVAVFPANIYMYQQGGAAFGVSDAVLFARLPLQAILIAWAYGHTR